MTGGERELEDACKSVQSGGTLHYTHGGRATDCSHLLKSISKYLLAADTNMKAVTERGELLMLIGHFRLSLITQVLKCCHWNVVRTWLTYIVVHVDYVTSSIQGSWNV